MVVALSWVFAPGAMAGGPTSVLVISPESGESAALYYSDADYGALLHLLGEDAAEGRTDRPPSLDMAVGTRQINVTWMVHDVQPWRVDRVYPGAREGFVWIHTSTQLETQQGSWHRARKPAELTALFKKLGLMGGRTGGAGAAQYPPAGEEDQAPPPGRNGQQGEAKQQSGPAPAAAGTSRAGTGWWWAIPGAAGGAVLALVLRPMASRLPRPPFRRHDSPRESGPRQQLLDG